jgi:AsmA protein
VQGSWDDPIILPDPQSRIERSGAAQPILDAVRSRALREPVRSMIERLTGAPPAQNPAATAPALAGSSAPAEGAGGEAIPGDIGPAQSTR